MSVKSKNELKIEATYKYERISDARKKKLLANEKKYITVFYSFLIILMILSVIGCFCLAVFIKPVEIIYIIFSFMFFSSAIVSFILMRINLKKPEKDLIILNLTRVLKSTYKQISFMSQDQMVKWKYFVNAHSEACRQISTLNKEYKFDDNICKRRSYKEELNSKRQFDNFDYEKWIFKKIDEDLTYFYSLHDIYQRNIEKYNEYSSKYNSLLKYTSEKETEQLNVEFEIFNFIEKILFNTNKRATIERPNIILHISYTSPTGRNSYSDSHIFTYTNLINLVEKHKAIKEKDAEALLAKKLNKKEQSEKAKKLRELTKLEKNLEQREKSLNEREKSFLEATKDHIYTNDSKDLIEESTLKIEENMSLLQKMSILRAKFDNGEITYEEYKEERKALI